MRVIVVGLGVQGKKRRAVAGSEVVATVDPLDFDAEYRRIEEVPLACFDAALVCTPDDSKLEILRHLLANGKHVLVEKPLLAVDEADLHSLAELSRSNGSTCYTAYNHRFEPHFINLQRSINEREFGEIYALRMFYGNGTARLVRDSAWRDQSAGVLMDLGSHLLDTLAFWFVDLKERSFEVSSASRFENRSFDHVTIIARGRPLLQLEMTLVSWRNHFTCDVYAENGSAHIESLCKWGPSTFTRRTRSLPSGRPDESAITLIQPDPTWALEYMHFKKLCATGSTNIETDIWINRVLSRLADTALMEFSA